MSVNPNSSARFTAISAAGTTVISDVPTNLVRVIFPGTYVGTVNLHDANAIAGTSATSQIVSFGLPTTSVAGNVEIGVHCAKGLVYQATGTPLLTIIDEK